MSEWRGRKPRRPPRAVQAVTAKDEIELINLATRNLKGMAEVSDSLIDDWIHKVAKARFLAYPDGIKKAELRNRVREGL